MTLIDLLRRTALEFHCPYCRRNVPITARQYDHLKPRRPADGSPPGPCYAYIDGTFVPLGNMIASCAACNQKWSNAWPAPAKCEAVRLEFIGVDPFRAAPMYRRIA